MSNLKSFIFLIILINLFACEQKNENVYTIDDVTFDAAFPGARLNKIEKREKDSYIAFIKPAFEPVNKSPWFAFGIESQVEKEIEITLNYGAYKHRYIPKISSDKKSWEKMDQSKIEIDTVSGEATLTLKISPNKIYVAAQEVISSHDTYEWMDNLLASHPEVKKIVAGKTVQNKDNYVLSLEKENINNSIVLIARQHPPEIPGGTIAFKHFYTELLGDTERAKSFRKQFNIYTFPLLNPDGADLGNWRHNANGNDLNRDWIDFSQPETQTVRTFINNKVEAGKKIQFALDFHTSYSGPYLLVLDSINVEKSNGIIPNWIDGIESNSEFRVEARPRSQDLPYCYNWFYNTFNSEAVTFEEGDEIDREIIVQRAKVYAQELMKTMTSMEY